MLLLVLLSLLMLLLILLLVMKLTDPVAAHAAAVSAAVLLLCLPRGPAVSYPCLLPGWLAEANQSFHDVRKPCGPSARRIPVATKARPASCAPPRATPWNLKAAPPDRGETHNTAAPRGGSSTGWDEMHGQCCNGPCRQLLPGPIVVARAVRPATRARTKTYSKCFRRYGAPLGRGGENMQHSSTVMYSSHHDASGKSPRLHAS